MRYLFFTILSLFVFLVSCQSIKQGTRMEPVKLQELKNADILKISMVPPEQADYIYSLNTKYNHEKEAIDSIISCLDFSGKDGYEPWEENYSFVLSFYKGKNLVATIYLYSFGWAIFKINEKQGVITNRQYYKYIPGFKGNLLLDYIDEKYQFKKYRDKEWDDSLKSPEDKKAEDKKWDMEVNNALKRLEKQEKKKQSNLTPSRLR